MPDAAPVADRSDADLLARIAAGEMGAFDALMKRHEGSIWRYARAHAAVEQDAEDIMQETFVAAWKSAHSYAGRGSARAWLLTIARHNVSHYYRRRVNEPGRLESLDEIALDAGWGSVSPDAEESASRELVAAALAHLPEADREILILRELEGLSGEETAELLQISLAAMKSRLHRARLKLVAAFQELNQ